MPPASETAASAGGSETVPFAGSSTITLDGVYRLRVCDFDGMLWPDDDGDGTLKTFNGMNGDPVLLAAAPFGGPIAVCHPSQPTEIRFFNAAGKSFSYANVSESVRFMCWNEREDHLIVVSDSGSVSFIDTDGNDVRGCQGVEDPFLCCTCRNGVVVYCADSMSLVLLHHKDGEYRRSVRDLSAHFAVDRPPTMVAIPDDVSPSGSVEVLIATEADQSEVVRVTFARGGTGEPREELCDLMVPFPIRAMAVSFSGERIAIAGEDGNIGCSTASMADYKPMVETGDDVAPCFLAWAGEHTVAFVPAGDLCDEIHLFSPRAALTNPPQTPEVQFFAIPEGATFIVEPDGLRCIAGHAGDCVSRFFQVIPECATRVYYRFNTRLPAALLRKAYDQFVMGDAESVATLRQLTGAGAAAAGGGGGGAGAGGLASADSAGQRLAVAIDDVLATAGFEFDIAQQKRLLRIAAYAKGFMPTYDSHEFVARCKRIRALRAIRDPQVGMMMTMHQLECIPVDRVARRLTEQHRHRLAFELCKALGGRQDLVVTAWCKAKMHAMLSAEGAATSSGGAQANPNEDPAHAKQLDERINQTLLLIMTRTPGLNYIAIADEAQKCRRDHLFMKLLEQEPSVANRVDALKHYGFMEQALAQAVDSGDAGLVYNCLIHLAELPDALFPKLAAVDVQRNDTVATDLACVYLTHFATAGNMQKEALKTRPELGVHLQLLQYLESLAQHRRMPADKRIRHHETSVLQILTTLGGVSEWCREARQRAHAQGRKEREAEFQTLERQIDMQEVLINEQRTLAQEAGDLLFLNLSVLQTLQRIWETSIGRPPFAHKANEFAKKFAVTEKQSQWAKLRAFAARNSPQSIAEMGGLKAGSKVKSVLPPMAFVDVLMRMGSLELAAQFVARLPRIEDRLEHFVQCKAWGEAAAQCVKHKQPDMLDQLRARAGNDAEAVAAINRAVGQ